MSYIKQILRKGIKDLYLRKKAKAAYMKKIGNNLTRNYIRGVLEKGIRDYYFKKKAKV